VTALVVLERQVDLTDAEKNLAELLIVLIEAYVTRADVNHHVSQLKEMEESLLANDPWRKN
jgi:hypothetical protein